MAWVFEALLRYVVVWTLSVGAVNGHALHAAAAREAPRIEAIEADFEARGELPPWNLDTKRAVEDGD